MTPRFIVKARIAKDRTDDTGYPWKYNVDAVAGDRVFPIDYGSHETQAACMASVEYALTNRDRFDYTDTEIRVYLLLADVES